MIGDFAGGISFYLLAKGEGPTNFETHFNPKLALHSNYFAALNNMMNCAEKNAHVSDDKKDVVCAKEFKALRLAAFKDELLYHNVNQRFFMNELAYKSGQSPY
jgi:hypothetical protein